ncbi:glycoside hydrolase family 95 protein [Butyrivibrio sp. WCD3002]|uniref:glycoside hydrolase family 95 protein n=1 Tax=Butyrivibrio sp. WCD3002 TaxID=1280676 RepID=UPI00040F3DA8|nr:glycoside hydrolase family 95 protein [Butyrivibrio sp. WCD3002]
MKKQDILTFTEGADRWEDAIPVGNGYLGAMVYGHTSRDRIQLNEDSLWNGKGFDRINPKALEKLPEIRKLIFQRKFMEAERLMLSHMISSPSSMTNYSTLGELDISMNQEQAFPDRWFPESDAEKYKSELDMMNGILTISHEEKGISYKREVFASYKKRVLCVHIESDKEKAVNLDVALNRYPYRDVKVPDDRRPGKFLSGGIWAAPRCDRIYTESGRLFMEGNEAGTKFGAGVCIVTDGTVEDCYSRLSVYDATEVTIYLAALTDNRAEDYKADIERFLDGALKNSYSEIKAEHIQDFSGFMERCYLDVTEDERASKYFSYGRYLFVSSSRVGSNAMNLQGIWNYEFAPSWDSKHTLNINQQMNYWPAEVCNLSDLHEPQFELLSKLEKNGEECARKMYGCRGMVCHHNTDFYGDCGTQDVYPAATFWVVGCAWLAMHIIEHYKYTLDKEFLREKYPLIRKTALFFVDFLIQDEEGYLVTNPSCSPENRFVTEEGYDTPLCAGPAMDNQIIRALMKAVLESADILEIDEPLKSDFENIISKLRPDGIDSMGRLLEWAKEEQELTPDMAHVSHLYAVYPGDDITESTPELFEAAKKSLLYRIKSGANIKEWPGAWQLSLFARFKDSENTDKSLKYLLDHSLTKSYLNATGVFQIDANMGILAGMAECLIQSHDGITLLPALPVSWKNGEVHGLRARGDVTVSIKWENSRIVKATVTSGHGGKVFFNNMMPQQSYAISTAAVMVEENEQIRITKKEGGFEIDLPKGTPVELVF